MNSEKERFEKYKKKLLEIIAKQLTECKVYLFGSRARGIYQPGADIDLALDAGKPIDFRVLFKIQDEIEDSTIPLMVDLVDLHSVSDKLRNEVKKEGVLWKI